MYNSFITCFFYSFYMNKFSSQLSEWWINAAYLDYRWPVVVWSSPGLVFPLQEFRTLDDQLSYAAKVIVGALDYKKMLDE